MGSKRATLRSMGLVVVLGGLAACGPCATPLDQLEGAEFWVYSVFPERGQLTASFTADAQCFVGELQLTAFDVDAAPHVATACRAENAYSFAQFEYELGPTMGVRMLRGEKPSFVLSDEQVSIDIDLPAFYTPVDMVLEGARSGNGSAANPFIVELGAPLVVSDPDLPSDEIRAIQTLFLVEGNVIYPADLTIVDDGFSMVINDPEARLGGVLYAALASPTTDRSCGEGYACTGAFESRSAVFHIDFTDPPAASGGPP